MEGDAKGGRGKGRGRPKSKNGITGEGGKDCKDSMGGITGKGGRGKGRGRPKSSMASSSNDKARFFDTFLFVFLFF